MIESGRSVYLAVIWVGETIVLWVSMGAWQIKFFKFFNLNRKKPRAGPERLGTEEDRRRMTLAMVMTNYRITYYTHFKK